MSEVYTSEAEHFLEALIDEASAMTQEKFQAEENNDKGRVRFTTAVFD